MRGAKSFYLFESFICPPLALLCLFLKYIILITKVSHMAVFTTTPTVLKWRNCIPPPAVYIFLIVSLKLNSS